MSQTLFDADDTIADAILSSDRIYRYWLLRRWGRGSLATFVMLNPSTADASQDDPTIRRCIGFAKSWGMAGIAVVNLYALRATNPADLWMADDPVGPRNDGHLEAAATISGGPVVAAWGSNARADRIERVLALQGMDRLQALGVTTAGQPRHPLYLRADATLTPWEVPA